MSDPVRELKRELLAAAERRQRRGVANTGRIPPLARLVRPRVLLAAATASVVAAGALLVTTPWSTPPGFLEQAQAALTPPAGMILHQKWEYTTTSTDPVCTVTRGPNEIWVDLTPPRRFRLLLNDLAVDPEADARPAAWRACASGTPSELGGAFDTGETLRFVPPNTLTFSGVHVGPPIDPAEHLREAISDGRAHEEGETQLAGRTVKRIRIDALPPFCPSGGEGLTPEERREDGFCSPEPDYVYVDPDTFIPVRYELPNGLLTSVRGPAVLRLLVFEYLPRTPENLRLTDIRAQHPTATRP